MQPQAVGVVERKVQYRRASLSGVPLPGDIGVEDVTDLPAGVYRGAEEQDDVTHQAPTRGQLDTQG